MPEDVQRIDLVIADKEMLIDKIKANISQAKRDLIHMKYSFDDKEKSIDQWNDEIKNHEKELSQLRSQSRTENGGNE